MTAGPTTTLGEIDAIRRMQALARYYQEHPLEVFEPSPALVGFMEDPSPSIVIRAASRVGKTMTCAARMAKVLLTNPGRRYRAVGVDFKQASQVIGRYLADFLPKSALAPGCRYSARRGWSDQLIQLKNGATCQIKTYEQDADSHAGDDLDGVWLDEPPPLDIWMESLRRTMAHEGWIWVSLTPVGRPVAWFKALVEAENSGWKPYVVEMSAKNCPWYTPDQVDKWIEKARTVPDAFRQTIYGDWEGITLERVYTGYDSSCHFTDLSEIPKHAKWGMGIDHGEGARKQVSTLVAWDDRSSHTTQVWLVGETVSPAATTPEQDAKQIRGLLLLRHLDVHQVHRWIGDSNSAGKRSPGEKINDILAQALAKEAEFHKPPRPIEVPWKGPGSVQYGEQLVNAAFLRRQIKVYAAGCPNLCKTLAHHDHKQPDLVHLSDAMRYILYPILDKSSMPSIGSVSLGLR